MVIAVCRVRAIDYFLPYHYIMEREQTTEKTINLLAWSVVLFLAGLLIIIIVT